MAEVKGFLIDLGGVVYQAGAPVPGSPEAITRLREAGVPFRFLTNTTSRPKSSIMKKLLAVGLAADGDDIFTPADAARDYIVAHGLDPYYLVSTDLMEDFLDIPAGAAPAVIVGDAGDDFTYRNMNLAFRRIEAGAELVALASNRKFVDDEGEISLDVGAYVAALEYASGSRATILGKPSADFFRLAVDALGLAAGETAMIGDDAEFDASAAVRAGLVGVLVRTGKWKPGAVDGLDPKPTFEFSNLQQAVDRLLS